MVAPGGDLAPSWGWGWGSVDSRIMGGVFSTLDFEENDLVGRMLWTHSSQVTGAVGLSCPSARIL